MNEQKETGSARKPAKGKWKRRGPPRPPEIRAPHDFDASKELSDRFQKANPVHTRRKQGYARVAFERRQRKEASWMAGHHTRWTRWRAYEPIPMPHLVRAVSIYLDVEPATGPSFFRRTS